MAITGPTLLVTIIVDRLSFDPLPAMEVDDVLIVALSSGHVLGLRRTPTDSV
jgi:hypothetical protein